MILINIKFCLVPKKLTFKVEVFFILTAYFENYIVYTGCDKDSVNVRE